MATYLKILFCAITGMLFTGAASAEAPPLGYWEDKKSGLYVSVTEISNKSDRTLGAVCGERLVTVGGTPPQKGKADDILIPSTTKGGDTAVLTGAFNWDTKSNEVTAIVIWKDGQPALEIQKNAGYARYPVGKYALVKRKDP